jgi:hypothetical protein
MISFSSKRLISANRGTELFRCNAPERKKPPSWFRTPSCLRLNCVLQASRSVECRISREGRSGVLSLSTENKATTPFFLTGTSIFALHRQQARLLCSRTFQSTVPMSPRSVVAGGRRRTVPCPSLSLGLAACCTPFPSPFLRSFASATLVVVGQLNSVCHLLHFEVFSVQSGTLAPWFT